MYQFSLISGASREKTNLGWNYLSNNMESNSLELACFHFAHNSEQIYRKNYEIHSIDKNALFLIAIDYIIFPLVSLIERVHFYSFFSRWNSALTLWLVFSHFPLNNSHHLFVNMIGKRSENFQYVNCSESVIHSEVWIKPIILFVRFVIFCGKLHKLQWNGIFLLNT